MTSVRPSFLQLVGAHTSVSGVRLRGRVKKIDSQDYWQPMLFPELSTHTITPVKFENITGSIFFDIFNNSAPKYVIDVRLAPRFDYFGLNRSLAFKIFSSNGHKYYDYAGNVEAISSRDVKFNPAFLAIYIKSRVFNSLNALGGIVLLMDASQPDEIEYAKMLSEQISTGEERWDYSRLTISK